jgi:signal transduction histidine kinase
LSKDKKRIEIDVRDNGCGIPETDMGHLFDPFFTTKAEGEGTGLGLSIVYGVIRNHRGNVHVSSAVGKGSVFTLSLPTH